jgi:hypothetical protein
MSSDGAQRKYHTTPQRVGGEHHEGAVVMQHSTSTTQHRRGVDGEHHEGAVGMQHRSTPHTPPQRSEEWEGNTRGSGKRTPRGRAVAMKYSPSTTHTPPQRCGRGTPREWEMNPTGNSSNVAQHQYHTTPQGSGRKTPPQRSKWGEEYHAHHRKGGKSGRGTPQEGGTPQGVGGETPQEGGWKCEKRRGFRSVALV